jgi:hypothetical protein
MFHHSRPQWAGARLFLFEARQIAATKLTSKYLSLEQQSLTDETTIFSAHQTNKHLRAVICCRQGQHGWSALTKRADRSAGTTPPKGISGSHKVERGEPVKHLQHREPYDDFDDRRGAESDSRQASSTPASIRAGLKEAACASRIAASVRASSTRGGWACERFSTSPASAVSPTVSA